MYSEYFDGWDIRPEFAKEFVSIFDGWLGEKNLHKLDHVSEDEWERFNVFLKLLAKEYDIKVANSNKEILDPLGDIRHLLSSHGEQKEKDAESFIRVVIPSLECVVTEDWDYTFIVWHKDNGAVEAIKPLVEKAGLYSWSDNHITKGSC